MTANERDIELCELYLDHELADAEARSLADRLEAEVPLRATIDRLRGQRARRLEAMSTAFDTDAASVERLVAGVRAAQARELTSRQSFWRRPSRGVLAAAASVAIGLTLGSVLHVRDSGRWSTSPASTGETPTVLVTSGSTVGLGSAGVGEFAGHGQYVVRLVDAAGNERFKVRFHAADQARQFIETFNPQPGPNALRVGSATIQDETY